MKILWSVNVVIPCLAEKLNIKDKPVVGGWLDGLYNSIKNNDDIELLILMPQYETADDIVIKDGKHIYYAYGPNKSNKNSIDEYIERFRKIINKEKPDIAHIFGTEYQHSLAMIRAFNNSNKTVVSIQGLVSVYPKHYLEGLTLYQAYMPTFRALRTHSWHPYNIYRMKKNGETELQAIKSVSNVIGRTDWDYACTHQINPDIKYYKCNETLRNSFYKQRWNYKNCEKHSIFLSQTHYPIKGLHYMLEAMPYILKIYPDAHLYALGINRNTDISKKDLKKLGVYDYHIYKLIKKYNLSDCVTFLGKLNENEMCGMYCKSNVFVCPSTIENSPNSVGEAMILGTPTISSDVGGVKNMLTHEKEGFIYQSTAPYMLAYYVNKLFGMSEDEINTISVNARKHALDIFDRKKNANRTIEIYNYIFRS